MEPNKTLATDFIEMKRVAIALRDHLDSILKVKTTKSKTTSSIDRNWIDSVINGNEHSSAQIKPEIPLDLKLAILSIIVGNAFDPKTGKIWKHHLDNLQTLYKKYFPNEI